MARNLPKGSRNSTNSNIMNTNRNRTKRRTILATTTVTMGMAMGTIALPINDDFADRIMIDGTNVMVQGNSEGATRELDEPGILHSSYNESSVWWSWRAPTSGWVRIDTLDSAYNTRLGVYVGDSLPDLNPVACNDNVQIFNRSLVEFQTKPGEVYQIAVGSSSSYGEIGLNVAFEPNSASPSEVGSDSFERRPHMEGMQAVGVANNHLATRDLDEPGIYSDRYNEYTKWWSWTAPETGRATIDTIMTTARGVVNDFNTMIGVYVGEELPALKPVAKNDNAQATKTRSRVRFQTKAGQTYQIAVGAASGTGNILLNVGLELNGDPASEAGSDRYEDRSAIVTTEFTGVADNYFATRDLDEPGVYHNSHNEYTVWWSWTAAADGPVQINSAGSECNAILAVYTGNSIDVLAPIAIDDNSWGSQQAVVHFDAVRGRTYEIALGAASSPGVARINLAQQAAITDDVSIELASAIRFYAEPGTIYQPQHSEDLYVWKDLGEAVIGQGQLITRFSLMDSQHRFFRAKPIGFVE